MIFTSPRPDVEIPDVDLASYVLSGADRWAERPALIDGPSGRTLTYREVERGVRTVAAALSERGFQQGDVLGLYLPNMIEFPLVFLAAASLGGLVTTANPLLTAEELGPQLRDAGARMLVTAAPLLERARAAAQQAGISHIISVGGGEGTEPFHNLMAAKSAPPSVTIDPTDVVALPYSSGTTGLSKGVMLTHRNLVANIVQMTVADVLPPNPVLIAVLPFYHIYGMTVVMNAGLVLGGTIVIMPRFDLGQFLDMIERYRVVRAHLVPPIVLALAKHPAVEGRDFSSLHSIMSGAAPLGAELEQAAADRVGAQVKQGYGLTETSPVTHVVPSGVSRPGSIGPLLPNTEARVVDLVTGAELAEGETGEICIRGPQCMIGYLNKPEATAATIDSDGWLHTGDVGYAGPDGYFYIVDRYKELIKYKGYQVAPAELEALLVAHPAVADAAVIGSPDDEAGEVPKAFVVLKGPVTAEELMAYVAGHVAPHKRVRKVAVVDEIPKSASGKILRRLLVEQERAAV